MTLTNIYISPISINVGIGTTIPRTTLDVIGSLITSGNIGIGTTIPRSNLHIEGGIYVTQNINVKDLNYTGTFTKNNLELDLTAWLKSGNDIYTNSNVGIGTTLPRSKLDVLGNIQATSVTSTLYGIANATLYASNSTYASNLLGNPNITVGTISSGNATMGAISVSAITSTTITTNNNNINAGTGTITATTFSGNLVGIANVATIASNALGLTGIPNITIGNISSGNVTMGTISSGNVTVGTLSGGNITTGTITTNNNSINAGTGTITSGNVTMGTISSGNVTVGTISAGNITTGTITTNNNSINAGTGTITSGNVTMGTLSAGNITTGNITTNNNSINVGTGTITSGNVTVGTISSGNVTVGTISAGNVTIGTITTNNNSINVGTGTITSGNVTMGTISSGNVTVGTLSAGNITTGTITTNNNSINAGTGTITSGNVTMGTISSGNVTVGTLSAGNITTGTITTNNNSINAGTGTITSGNVTMGTLSAGNITTGTITTNNNNINAGTGTITSGNVTMGTISSGNVTIGTISSGNVTVGTISAGNITTGTITTNNNSINAGTGTITSGNITMGTISSGNVTMGTISSGNVTVGIITTNNNSINAGTGTITSGNVTMGTISSSAITATNATISGTIITSNLTVLGSNTIINTYTTSTSNFSICNITGTGPALSVYQKGSGLGYPIADFYDVDVSIDVPVLRIADGGSIGIGTSIPLKTLDVNGDINFTGNLYQNNVIFNGGGGSSQWSSNISSNTLYYTEGNVGIGTTIAKEKLQINGNIIANSFIGSLTGIANAAITASNALGLIGTPSITVDTISSGAITATSITAPLYGIANASLYASNSTYASNLLGNPNITVGTISSGNATVGTISSGNVTVGTISSGAITATSITAPLYGIANATLYASNSTYTSNLLGNPNITVGTISSGAITATSITAPLYGIANATLYASNSTYASNLLGNPNITVGTMSSGAITATSITAPLYGIANATLYASNSTYASNLLGNPNITVGTISSGNVTMGTISSGNVTMGTISSGNVTVGTISSGNITTGINVGIGTTQTRKALDVVGDIITTTNIGIGTTVPRAPLHVHSTSFFNNNIGIGTTQTRKALDVVGDIITTTNVGIGTTVPRQKLDVSGTIIASGNIGIGTTNPNFPLHVWSGINNGANANIAWFGYDSNIGLGPNNDQRTTVTVRGSGGNTNGGSAFQLRHITASMVPNSDYIARLTLNGTNVSDIPYVNSGINSSLQLFTETNNALQLGTNCNVRVTISSSSACVGIGTTIIRNALDVIGDIITTTNVGIGTIRPTHKLHIYSTSSTDNDYESAGIMLENSTSNEVGIAFKTAAMGGTSNWVIGVNSNQTRLDIGYGLGANLVNDADTAMTVLTNKNVGIGTTIPTSILHLEKATSGDGGTNNGTNSVLSVKQNTSWNGNQPWALYVSGYSYLNGFRISASEGIRALHKVSVGGLLGFSCQGDDPITFTQSVSNERMRINSGGNVGIGTIAPTHKLHIYSTSSTDNDYESAGIMLENSTSNEVGIAFKTAAMGGTSNWVIGINSNQTRLDIGYGLGTNLVNDAGTAMTVLTNKNVGIGTTNPQYPLDVTGVTRMQNILYMNNQVQNCVINLYKDAGGFSFNSATTSYFGFGVNSGILRYCVPGSSYSHAFYANTTLLMSITGTGNVTASSFVGSLTGVANAALYSSNSTYASNLLGNPNITVGTISSGNATIGTISSGNATMGTISSSAIMATNATISGTIITSNLTVLGSNTIINTYTTSTSNFSICNITGTGPALSVYQKGSGLGYPIADFYDVDVSITIPALRIADGGSVGIGTSIPLKTLDVNGDINFTGSLYQNNALYVGSQWSSNILLNTLYYSDGNIGIGTTISLEKLQVNGNSIIGSGQLGSVSGISGGPFFKQVSWDSTSNIHPLIYPIFCYGDNSAGTLFIQVSNKLTTGTRKIGTGQYSYIKNNGNNTDIFEIAQHRNTNLSTFTLTTNGDDIIITTDSDCSISWTSIGSY